MLPAQTIIRKPFELSPGYSAQNAWLCALAARDAYNLPATIDEDETDTQLIITDHPEAIVIAFRGTQGVADFLTDAKFRRAAIITVPGAEVHRGFLRAYCSVDMAIKARLVSLPSLKPIFITGHSLGGALATLCARSLAEDPLFSNQLHSVYTFGQPRVGNGKFSRYYNWLKIGSGDQRQPSHSSAVYSPALKDHTYRFINAEDIVPRVPGWLMGYRHVGARLFFSSFRELELNPTLWLLALSDLCGVVNAWVLKRELTLLTSHGMDRYLDQLSTLKSQPSTR